MLVDNFARNLKYLRLSITQKCNFKCTYCLPNGYDKNAAVNEMSVNEITNLVTALCEMGIEKIRLTGGEPTLRGDFFEIANSLSKINNLKTLCLTTNGVLLKKHAKKYLEAGISNLNISIDSLNSQTFNQLTSMNLLPRILDGIEECLQLPFKKIKINVVLLKHYNFQHIEEYFNFVKDKNIDVRFIILMPTQDNKKFYKEQYVSAKTLLTLLEEKKWQLNNKGATDGPANTFSHTDYQGRIGIINPYSNTFCDSCNRIRVDSHGKLLLCLLNFGSYSLREYLADSNQKEDLKQHIQTLLNYKPERNLLQTDKSVISNMNFSKIGG